MARGWTHTWPPQHGSCRHHKTSLLYVGSRTVSLVCNNAARVMVRNEWCGAVTRPFHPSCPSLSPSPLTPHLPFPRRPSAITSHLPFPLMLFSSPSLSLLSSLLNSPSALLSFLLNSPSSLLRPCLHPSHSCFPFFSLPPSFSI